jgi:UPF0148 protein
LIKKNEEIKLMADLLKSGAKLTGLTCPVCSSPIFKLKNEDLWCVKCQKKVIVVKEGEHPPETVDKLFFKNLELTLLDKIKKLNDRIREEEDCEQLFKLSEVLLILLESLEKARKMI